MPDRHGAKQPDRFNPARAAILDDTARFNDVAPETLLEYLALPQSATLVEFGAGTGLYAIAIEQRRPDVRVLALDEQLEMLEHLRASIARAGVSNVEAITPDALAALHGRVDGVLALNVLHELGDNALADVRSLLNANGVALFVDWNADADRPIGPPRDHVYNPNDARGRLESAGFNVENRPLLRYHYALVARAVARV